MALPKGMFRRGTNGTLWARKDVPKELQQIVGQTSLQASLREQDVRRALTVFHGVMQTFEARIASARQVLQNQQPGIGQTFTLDAPLWVQENLWRREQAKPEKQIAKLQARLEEARQIAFTPKPCSMDDLFDRWKAERKPSILTTNEYERSKNAFKKLNGDLPIAEYNTAHARAWKDHVLKMTDRKGRPLAHATLVKNFGAISTLFGLAERNELLTTNPFDKIKLEKPKRAKASKRAEWDDAELNKLFKSPVFSKRKRPRGGAGEAAYWLPVLALYHGFRAGELAQLDKADVIQRSGIWCLKISPSFEDGDSKSTKTEGSDRIVPLHRAVIALGFLDYVRTVKGKKL